MGESTLKNRVVTGLFWTFGERIITQGISFVLSIILARILMPSEFGVLALILVFINIANVFVSTGLGEALIQKKDSDESDFSTMFYCSFVVSVFLYVILFFLAPYIVAFYN